jgi:threonine dehydrogenase-like Zn-dependent dehydrogenase
MQYGRIVRVTYTLGGPYATYIVAEENAAKASAMMKAQVGADASVECIGRASKECRSSCMTMLRNSGALLLLCVHNPSRIETETSRVYIRIPIRVAVPDKVALGSTDDV